MYITRVRRDARSLSRTDAASGQIAAPDLGAARAHTHTCIHRYAYTPTHTQLRKPSGGKEAEVASLRGRRETHADGDIDRRRRPPTCPTTASFSRQQARALFLARASTRTQRLDATSLFGRRYYLRPFSAAAAAAAATALPRSERERRRFLILRDSPSPNHPSVSSSRFACFFRAHSLFLQSFFFLRRSRRRQG